MARSFLQLAKKAEKGSNCLSVSKEPTAKPELNIHTLGNTVLRQSAKRISKVDDSIRELVKQMLHSMYSAKGIGLAAPQVGIHKQLLVIDLDIETHSTPQ